MRAAIWMGLVMTATAGAATAQPAAVADVFACRSIAADAARLACFDRATAALDTATRTRDVVVLDKAEVKRTRRSLFGYALPRVPLFGGPADAPAAKAAEHEDVSEIDAVIATVTPLPDDRYRLTLEEGGAWRTTEIWSGSVRPKPGMAVHIARAALGSYMLRVKGGRTVRAQRIG